MWWKASIVLLIWMMGVLPAHAQSDKQEHEGRIDEKNTFMRYTVRLELGQGAIAIAEATSGDLDTQLFIYTDNGEIIAANDDRGRRDYDSEVVFIAEYTGIYTIEVTSYGDTMGEYRLTIEVHLAKDLIDTSRITFSGTPQFYDTSNFRIHYTETGVDATKLDYVYLVAEAMEEIYQLQVIDMGWRAPPPDRMRGGDDRYDVYIIDLINDSDGGHLGFARPENFERMRGISLEERGNTAPSFLALDNDYDLIGETAIPLMRSSAAHEFHHAIQFAYDTDEPHYWYYEATATWMEAVTFPSAQDATRYVQYVYNYPEICLGAEGDADPTGLLMYGSWMFMQSLADAYGYDVVRQLWENIAVYDGWEALTRTLDAHNDTLHNAVSRYHLQNIVRDYKYTPIFKDKTVWLDSRISQSGLWSHEGRGVQELAVNYIELALSNGIYDITLIEKEMASDLELWVMGVRDDMADVFQLGKAGTLLIKDYDYVYAVVMNMDYDEDLTSCEYAKYQLRVATGTRPPAEAQYQFFAEYFSPLRLSGE